MLGDSWIQNLDLGDSEPHWALAIVLEEAFAIDLEEALGRQSLRKEVAETAWSFEPTLPHPFCFVSVVMRKNTSVTLPCQVTLVKLQPPDPQPQPGGKNGDTGPGL